MKKNSQRQLKDYSKYQETDREFYGLLIKNGNVRIDTKRLEKTIRIDKEIVKGMNKPRKTVYFIPERKHAFDYMCNIFRESIKDLENFWKNEFILAFRAIKTPEDAHKKAFTGHFMQTGILDYDEVSIYANVEANKRSYAYAFIIKSLVAQFIHQMVSTIEATTIQVITQQGYDKENFNRNQLESFLQGKKSGIKLDKIPGYEDYDRLYQVWHFLKHNSINLYNKIKDKYPDLLNENEYKNGELALYVLNIDRKFVTKMFDKIRIFFDHLCEQAFNENIFEAQWNFETFFIGYIDSEIKSINNPLGIPGYV